MMKRWLFLLIALLHISCARAAMNDDVNNPSVVSPLTGLTTTFTGLSVNNVQSLSLSSVPTTGATTSSVAFSFSYTALAPTGMTCVWNPGLVNGGTVTTFSASGGSGSGHCPTPSTAGTYTMTATGTGPNTASATASNTTAISTATACPDDDGSNAASAGTAQSPNLLVGYAATINGTNGLGCKVAGVDYHVGLPAGTTLVVPTSGNIPAGTSISGNIITITANDVTFQGFDMTGKSIQGAGISGLTIQYNKFVVTACVDPPIWIGNGGGVSGATIIQYNDFDGGGSLCGTGDATPTNPQGYSDGSAADVYVQDIAAGATLSYQYNYHINANSDDVDVSGPGSGTTTFFDQYNYFSGGGWGGHPDGIQFCGGNFATPTVRHNTFLQPQALVGIIDTQVFHVEAQCTSNITNARVIFNTTVQPGSQKCISVDTLLCTSNSVISCKNDNPGAGSSNSGFAAYGNYLDWTTSSENLDDANACTSTTWGSPYANYDMTLGTPTPVNLFHWQQ
jgi:hypothetical protein